MWEELDLKLDLGLDVPGVELVNQPEWVGLQRPRSDPSPAWSAPATAVGTEGRVRVRVRVS